MLRRYDKKKTDMTDVSAKQRQRIKHPLSKKSRRNILPQGDDTRLDKLYTILFFSASAYLLCTLGAYVLAMIFENMIGVLTEYA